MLPCAELFILLLALIICTLMVLVFARTGIFGGSLGTSCEDTPGTPQLFCHNLLLEAVGE